MSSNFYSITFDPSYNKDTDGEYNGLNPAKLIIDGLVITEFGFDKAFTFITGHDSTSIVSSEVIDIDEAGVISPVLELNPEQHSDEVEAPLVAEDPSPDAELVVEDDDPALALEPLSEDQEIVVEID